MIFEEKTIKSDRIYEGSILNLRRDKVTVLHGTSYREIVEHNGGAVLAADNRRRQNGDGQTVSQTRRTCDARSARR